MYIGGMKDKRDQFIRLTLSVSEAEAIKEAAHQQGLSPAAWCRQQTVTQARNIIGPQVKVEVGQ